jgi:hypothetical protein
MAMRRTQLREARLSDRVALAGMLRGAGFRARSEAGWRWLFEQNPANARQRRPPPAGWVLEGEGGRLLGYLGNILLDYTLDGQPVRAATCTAWVTAREVTGEGIKLLRAWYLQPEVELFLTTTANRESEAHYRMFGSSTPEEASFASGLAWVGRDEAAVSELLSKRGVSPLGARLGAALGGPAVWAARHLTRIGDLPRAAENADVRCVPLERVDERFTAVWERHRERPGLALVRDAAHLRWTLSDPDARSEPVIFGAFERGELRAWAIAASHHPTHSPEEHLRLLDLVAPDGQRAQVAGLLHALLDHSRRTGASLLYCPPVGRELHALLYGLGGLAVKRESASHFLRARKRKQTGRYLDDGSWRATGLDGDSPLCLG